MYQDSSASSMLLPLIGVLAIIFLAYLATVWLSKRMRTGSSGRHIKIKERVMLGKDSCLLLIEMNGKIYFLSVTGSHSELLDQFGVEELEELPLEELQPILGQNTFAELLAKASKGIETVGGKLKNRQKRGKK